MAETRETQVLEDVVESTEIENPRTTEEAILAKIIAGEEVDINARTRYQAYLKELSSISGGNPNYVENIAGTLANPWGDTSTVDLASEISNMVASAYMDVDATALGMGVAHLVATPYADAGDIAFQAIGLAASSADEWQCATARYKANNGNLSGALILNSGTVTDISSYASVIPVVLTIIRHPLPEDNT